MSDIKHLAKTGAFRAIEGVIEDLKKDINPPRYQDSANRLLYETGKYEGTLEGLDLLMERLNDLANE